MHARLKSGERGQALVETAICLPIVMLALFAVIYFCNLGIVSTRVQLTARYGALNMFAANSGPAYSASDLYNGTSYGSVCSAPPTTLLTNGAPLANITPSPTFWNPGPSPAPSSSCSLFTKDLGGASFLMARYLTAGSVNVNAAAWASVIPDYYKQQIFGGTTPNQVSESLNWVHAAWPGAIVACINKTGQEVEDLLTATETVALPTGWSPGSCNIQH